MDREIPFEDNLGNKYLLLLNESNSFKEYTSMKVVYVVFQPSINTPGGIISNIFQVSNFLKISIQDYFRDNPDVIMFYNADFQQIRMNEKRIGKKLPYSVFRHNLFLKLFERHKVNSMIHEEICRSHDGYDHRICLFSTSNHKHELQKLKLTLTQLFFGSED